MLRHHRHARAQAAGAHHLRRPAAARAVALSARHRVDQSPGLRARAALRARQVTRPLAVHAHLALLFLEVVDLNHEERGDGADGAARERSHDGIDKRELPRKVDGLDEVEVGGSAEAHLDLGEGRDETAEGEEENHARGPVDVVVLERILGESRETR